MSKKYKAIVNNQFTYDLDTESVLNLDSVSINENKFHVLHKNKPFVVEIITTDFLKKEYTIKVNKNLYNVSIENDLDQLIKEMGFETGTSRHINTIKAPMPGLILDISVSVGQEVKENDNLLILEAMKMENCFLSPRDGIIKSISVNKGDAVDKGMLLIEFE